MPTPDNPIDAWWSAFEAKSPDIDALFSRKEEWDLVEWMQEHLGQIHPQLMWEFGPAVHTEGHRLVITPESRRDLRPIVDSVLKRAPKMDGWEFYAYRIPEDFEMAVQTVEARSGGDISETSFRASIGEYNRIDLVFVAEDYSDDDEQAFSDVFVAAETLLGEEILEKWIGIIETEAASTAGSDELHSIRELQPRVNELIAQIRSGLPDQPYHKLPEEQQWTLFELEPEEADDYPFQWDIFVGKTMIEPLWRNAHSNQTFDSVRYSRHGEIFCYVKIDGADGLDEDGFADKGEIEDALEEALRAAEVGCVIGGGTGLRYAYVDLALADLEQGAEVVKRVLREGKIPERSWILFYDTDLAARWIGIWDNTPTPLLPEFE